MNRRDLSKDVCAPSLVTFAFHVLRLWVTEPTSPLDKGAAGKTSADVFASPLALLRSLA